MYLHKFPVDLSIVIFMLNVFISMCRSSNAYQDLTFASAQCYAMCLKNFLKIKESKEQCTKSCKGSPNMCDIGCPSSEPGCLSGCKFLKETLDLHPGKCPSTSDTNAIKQPSCLSKCKSDKECFNTLHKCCKIGCSNICVKPIYNDSIPELPVQLIPIKIPNSSEIEFDWMSQYKTFIHEKNPLFFILQTRVCSCRKFDESYADKWQTLIITSQSGARLNEFDHGKIYQFRLAAVSADGARGFGIPSTPFPEIVERPNNPASVKGLSELLTRVYSTGKISVTIRWAKSDEYVFPISEYAVKWMIDYGYVQSDGQAISALTQFTQSVPPDKTTYVLEDLKPNTTYRVEVLTKVYWNGDETLVSEPSTLFLSTPSLSHGRLEEIFIQDFQGPATNCSSSSVLRHADATIHLSNPTYKNGETSLDIKINDNKDLSSLYRVSFTPKICIDPLDNQMTEEHRNTRAIESKSNVLTISNLFFNCQYHIQIEIISLKTYKKHHLLKPIQIEGYFCVPSCTNIAIAESSEPLKCADYLTLIPSQPENLTSKLVNSLSKTYELSWRHPVSVMVRNEDIYHSRYRITWGPRLNEPIKQSIYATYGGIVPIMDSSKSNVKVINKNVNSLILTNLQPRTMYIVKAQLLVTLLDGLELESDMSVHYFNTGAELIYSMTGRGATRRTMNSVSLSIATVLTTIVISLL